MSGFHASGKLRFEIHVASTQKSLHLQIWLILTADNVKNAIGAIDGSHIPCAPPVNHSFFLDHKGIISMNCLFACNFALKSLYTLTGWEGTVTDALEWQDACQKDIVIPKGKYFLGDSGLSITPEILTSYCCI